MRLLSSVLFVLFLIVSSGCGPAPIDASSISSTARTQPIAPSRQDTELYLPNIVGGKVEVAATTADGQEWLRYNHAYWGMTFDYPAGWQVDMPDLEARVGVPEGAPDFACLPEYTETTDCTYTIGYTNTTDMQRATTYGYQVTLKPPERAVGASDIAIFLETVVLAPGMPLREWIKINRQYLLWFHGGDWESYEPKLVRFPGEERPNVDELWMDLAEDGDGYATIYMSIGKLVYAIWFVPGDPALQKLAEHIVASLEFDLDTQRELAALPYYSAEITGYSAEMTGSQPFPDEPTPVPLDEPPAETPIPP